MLPARDQLSAQSFCSGPPSHFVGLSLRSPRARSRASRSNPSSIQTFAPWTVIILEAPGRLAGPIAEKGARDRAGRRGAIAIAPAALPSARTRPTMLRSSSATCGHTGSRRISPSMARSARLASGAKPPSRGARSGTPATGSVSASTRCVEEVFGWTKAQAGYEKVNVRGRGNSEAVFTFAAAAYKVLRIPTLLAGAAT